MDRGFLRPSEPYTRPAIPTLTHTSCPCPLLPHPSGTPQTLAGLKGAGVDVIRVRACSNISGSGTASLSRYLAVGIPREKLEMTFCSRILASSGCDSVLAAVGYPHQVYNRGIGTTAGHSDDTWPCRAGNRMEAMKVSWANTVL